MHDIVAVRVMDGVRGDVGFLTWGRIFDVVDEAELLETVRRHAHAWGLRDVQSASICYTLREAATYEYFFESFFEMCNEGIPFGKKYASWAKRKRRALLEGKQLWFLGGVATREPR